MVKQIPTNNTKKNVFLGVVLGLSVAFVDFYLLGLLQILLHLQMLLVSLLQALQQPITARQFTQQVSGQLKLHENVDH